MGAGASTSSCEEVPPVAIPEKRVKPSREQATVSSMMLAANILLKGAEAQKIDIINKGKKQSWKGGGFLRGDAKGLFLSRNAKSRESSIGWEAKSLSFGANGAVLTISTEDLQWELLLSKRPNVAAWLGCYLYAFVGPREESYEVSFRDWGRLGIAFAVYGDVVLPVVFSVNSPASTLGVKPASVLISINGTKILDIPEDESMLDFISNCDFPKNLVFKRLPHAQDRLFYGRTRPLKVTDLHEKRAPLVDATTKLEENEAKGKKNPTVASPGQGKASRGRFPTLSDNKATNNNDEEDDDDDDIAPPLQAATAMK